MYNNKWPWAKPVLSVTKYRNTKHSSVCTTAWCMHETCLLTTTAFFCIWVVFLIVDASHYMSPVTLMIILHMVVFVRTLVYMYINHISLQLATTCRLDHLYTLVNVLFLLNVFVCSCSPCVSSHNTTYGTNVPSMLTMFLLHTPRDLMSHDKNIRARMTNKTLQHYNHILPYTCKHQPLRKYWSFYKPLNIFIECFRKPFNLVVNSIENS